MNDHALPLARTRRNVVPHVLNDTTTMIQVIGHSIAASRKRKTDSDNLGSDQIIISQIRCVRGVDGTKPCDPTPIGTAL